jgi:hypothetical protein
MSTSEPQPDDVRADELVAYLDGELSADAAHRVEQRLATDDAYRQQLGELDQAWSALEVLPTATVDDKFARTTIEMVALAAQQDLNQRSAVEKTESRRRMLWQVAGALAVIAAGFAIARTLLPSQNRALIADLPVIARIDELTQIGDIDFLRGLTKLNMQQFIGDDDSRTRALELEIPSTGWDNPEARRLWVEHLSADQKAELAGRLQRFESLPGGPEKQRRMRQLADGIAHASDSAELEKTMTAYAQWLNGQSQAKQAELRGLSSAERVLQVQKLTRQGNREAVRKLTPDEEQSLRDAVAKFSDDHRTELLDELRRDNPEAQRRAEKEPRFANMMVIWRAMRDEKWRDELQTQLTAALNELNRQYLEHLPSRFEQTMQLGRWVRAATNPKIGPQELERFFAETLSNDQREQLLNLPQGEMETRLERWYAASQLGIPERDWASFDPSDRPGRGGPGGPGFGRRDRDEGPRGRGEGPPPGGGEGRRRFRGSGDSSPDGPPPGGPPGRPPGERPWAPPPSDHPDDGPPGPPPR